MMFNTTTLANADTFYKLVVYANDSTNQILFALFVMSVFFIMIMALKRWEFDNAILVSSFICFVISIMLNYAQLMPIVWGLVFLCLTAFTALYVFAIKS